MNRRRIASVRKVAHLLAENVSKSFRIIRFAGVLLWRARVSLVLAVITVGSFLGFDQSREEFLVIAQASGVGYLRHVITINAALLLSLVSLLYWSASMVGYRPLPSLRRHDAKVRDRLDVQMVLLMARLPAIVLAAGVLTAIQGAHVGATGFATTLAVTLVAFTIGARVGPLRVVPISTATEGDPTGVSNLRVPRCVLATTVTSCVLMVGLQLTDPTLIPKGVGACAFILIWLACVNSAVSALAALGDRLRVPLLGIALSCAALIEWRGLGDNHATVAGHNCRHLPAKWMCMTDQRSVPL